MSCGTPSPVLPSQVWKSSAGNTGNPGHCRDSWGGDEQGSWLSEPHQAPPSWGSIPPRDPAAQPSAACGAASRRWVWDRLSRHSVWQRWLCHVPQKAPSEPGSVVRLTRTLDPLCPPACTIPWCYPGAGLDVCGCLTLKFQSTFSFRLSRSFWTAAVPSRVSSWCHLQAWGVCPSHHPDGWWNCSAVLAPTLIPKDNHSIMATNQCLNSTATIWTEQPRFSPKLPARVTWETASETLCNGKVNDKIPLSSSMDPVISWQKEWGWSGTISPLGKPSECSQLCSCPSSAWKCLLGGFAPYPSHWGTETRLTSLQLPRAATAQQSPVKGDSLSLIS